MTALELNAELFRQLSIIAEDETLMRKAVEAIRRLAQQKEAQTEETEYISKEEGIDIFVHKIPHPKEWIHKLVEVQTSVVRQCEETQKRDDESGCIFFEYFHADDGKCETDENGA